MQKRNFFRYSIIFVVFMWMFAFVFVAFVFALLISMLSIDKSHIAKMPFTVSNYMQIINSVYGVVFFRSALLAFFTTVLCLIISYPISIFIKNLDGKFKMLALLFILIPFLTSSLARTYAIMFLLGVKGPINQLLIFL